MNAPTDPGDRPSLRTFVPVLAVAATLSALVVYAAVAAAPAPVRAPLAWGGGAAAVVLSAAVATAAHTLRTGRAARHRLAGVTQDIGRLLQQQARATEEARQERLRLTDELTRQRGEFAATWAAERARLEQQDAVEAERLHQENSYLASELEQARRERDAAISATSNAAARMQALATAMLADLRAMEERHTDEDVLADLLHLDHRTAQAGRLADSIAVLTGARSGRRWARPIGMESVLRGAMGRIAGYRRVRLHSVSETAVAGHAAEGVMHALAELLDNAANFSPPTAEVHVYVEEVPAGVIVSVEDSGLVMGEVQLRRAERAVSGDVSGLGGLTGTRLGLAVVGRLARKHGLKVSFRPSARGGTGVLVLVPQDILTTPAPAERAAATARPVAASPAGDPVTVEAAPAQESDTPATEIGPAGLPRRRRGHTLAEAGRTRRPHDDDQRRAPDADAGRARAARFSSFRKAVRPTASGSRQAGPEPAPPTPGTAPGDHGASTSHSTAPDGQSAEAPRSAMGYDQTASPRESVSHTAEHTSPATSSQPHAHPEGDTTP
ncbi:histidine kinase [Streptomyces sp. MUSC 125]|uniref:sensor histidine kinase n=1 Tax=unclassified Streptomyces TaxID=2593676 RepID=UPI00057F7F34|nr:MULTISPECIES: ATP-binding protein [unclassified Streptomyces]KIE26676.1 histidine kinase [Streptomyces sp. MUSC 125]MCH0559200.1 sensor histidine kinase [Streptomyces sp. MUM 16J]